jgi:hypothetical protein
MHTSVGSKMQWFEPESWWQTGQDVVIGSVVGGYRAAYVVYVWFYVNTVRPLAHLVGVQLPDGKRPKVPHGTLKVAAVGFGRTGTVSTTSKPYRKVIYTVAFPGSLWSWVEKERLSNKDPH